MANALILLKGLQVNKLIFAFSFLVFKLAYAEVEIDRRIRGLEYQFKDEINAIATPEISSERYREKTNIKYTEGEPPFYIIQQGNQCDGADPNYYLLLPLSERGRNGKKAEHFKGEEVSRFFKKNKPQISSKISIFLFQQNIQISADLSEFEEASFGTDNVLALKIPSRVKKVIGVNKEGYVGVAYSGEKNDEKLKFIIKSNLVDKTINLEQRLYPFVKNGECLTKNEFLAIASVKIKQKTKGELISRPLCSLLLAESIENLGWKYTAISFMKSYVDAYKEEAPIVKIYAESEILSKEGKIEILKKGLIDGNDTSFNMPEMIFAFHQGGKISGVLVEPRKTGACPEVYYIKNEKWYHGSIPCIPYGC